ncbi:MAG: hypothetical protein EOP39_11160 [Rubrivivax sp.]|nr:MAG: hypothetical protein EOP39_11160 [Rubrivivax sp.]
MNLSHAYSDHAPKPKNYLGIGVVVALHVVGIYALSAGLITVTPRERPVTTVTPLPPDVVVKELTPPLEGRRPDFPQVPMTTVKPIEWTEVATVTTETIRNEPGPVAQHPPTNTGTVGGGTQVAVNSVKSDPVIRNVGAVCSVMPQPEIPALNWTGEAVLQVLATVRGGRVVGSDVRVMHGALDGKTRRSLQRSVESALAGYQCQGDAMFQQDFAFRID